MQGINAELKIELRSDLCSGSGMSNTGIVDMDIIYDDYGFPYIPAKRLKGCLREAAEHICPADVTDCLFGDRVTGKGACVEIGNALLKREAGMIDGLKAAKSSALEGYINSDAVLDMYTSIRAQTRIDEKTGVAKDNNLRYTRVVNQFDPFEDNQTNLCFYAPVFFNEKVGDNGVQESKEINAKSLLEYMKGIAKALRNIGIDRNRGLGSVRCQVYEIDRSQENSFVPENSKENINYINTGSPNIICYTIENLEPMILSDRDKNDSASFISGKSILGVLAGEYINSSHEKDPADTDEFEDLFLNGTVKYTNLNLLIGDKRSFPAPLYLNRLKKSGDYVNILKEKPQEKAESNDGNEGNLPKKLKNKYVSEILEGDSIGYLIDEVDKELNFHYTKQTEDEEQLLFSLAAVKKGQKFTGEIIIDSDRKEEYTKTLKDLLQKVRLRFGKSKSSQYGLCRLVGFSESEDKPVKFNKGDQIVVTLKSDTLFMDETGSYIVRFDKVKEMLAKELSANDDVLFKNMKEEDDPSIIDVTEVFGYNTTWNMKRSSAPAIKAGSAFIYELNKDWVCSKRFVGERTQEGFGEIEIHSLSEMTYSPECIDKDKKDKNEEKPEPMAELTPDIKKLTCHSLHGEIIEALLLSETGKKEEDLNASAIGRITLMLKESLSDESGNPVPPDEAVKEFGNRLQSIKTKSTRENALRYAEKTIQVANPSEGQKPKSINAPKKKEDFETYRINVGGICKILERQNRELVTIMNTYLEGEKENLIKETWGEYMLQSLTLMKYRKSENAS